nr:MAG TPA: hypothetical protein [Bacteriophage sp.]
MNNICHYPTPYIYYMEKGGAPWKMKSELVY